MVITVARIYAYKITLTRARELLVTFGVGFLGRTLFHELSKLGGPPGWLVGAAVAAGTTAAMGHAASIWFERGEKIEVEGLRRISRTLSEELIGRLRGIRRRRGRARNVRQQVAETLEGLSDKGYPTEDAPKA
jgi:uncharacterized protein (DUF697 family)